MATKTLITAEQYLSTHFEYEPEFVRGEIVERPLPNNTHSKIQQRLSVLLDRTGFCYPELRVRVAHGFVSNSGYRLVRAEAGRRGSGFAAVF